MAEDKGAGKGAKDSKEEELDDATVDRIVSAMSPEKRAFLNSVPLEARKNHIKLMLASGDAKPAKPILKKKFRVVAVRLGFDGLTLRHPGKKFTMDINVNDDWPDWVVKEEDYVPPPKEGEEDDEDGVAQRVQIRGGVKAGSTVVI